MKKNSKWTLIITMLIMVSILTILFVSKELTNKKNMPEKSTNNIVKNKSFAIMVTNENGIGYKEYEGDTWPEGYSLAKAECVDNNGSKVEEAVSYDESTNKVTLKAKRTVYCTLYFDEDTILNTLRKNDSNEVISKALVGDMYRYQGLDKQYSSETKKIVDNNYLCFGTNNEEECKDNPDKYMYRIIGVTSNNELKIIKMTGVTEDGTLLKPQWNNVDKVSQPYDGTSGDCDENKCGWPNILLYKRINGLSGGTSKGNRGNSNIFVNSSEYSYLSSTNGGNYWYNLIVEHSWKYGETNSDAIYNGDNAYKVETGQESTTKYWPEIGQTCNSSTPCTAKPNTWSNEVTSKIGLMYMHDYLYAYTNGNPGSSINAIKSWIYLKNNMPNNNNHEWLMTGWGLHAPNVNALLAMYIYNDGRLLGAYLDGADEVLIRPVFYIKNGIKIEGTGTENNPYIIINRNEDGYIYYDYEYTGNYQTFKAPETGTYKIELWGASGGGTKGLGAYTSGIIDLKKGNILYVYVGEAGYFETNITQDNYNQDKYKKYTFNGGAAGNFWCLKVTNAGSNILGGGATDVRLESGTWDNFNGLKSRIMVAAGGGGGVTNPGGAGGGITGYDGYRDTRPQITGNYQGKGGTQISGGIANGSFGKGGIATYNGDACDSNDGAGGGSGYYGGGGSIGVGTRTGGNGAGGSSYISGHNGCRAITSSSTEGNISHSDNSNHYSNMIFKETTMIDGAGYIWTNIRENLINQPSPTGGSQTGNSGNGFARITKIN